MYYVLENITVIVYKKCSYLGLASLLFLIFCHVIFLNKQYVVDLQTIFISS